MNHLILETPIADELAAQPDRHELIFIVTANAEQKIYEVIQAVLLV